MANTFVNYVSEKLIHKNKAGEREFANVSVPVAGSKSGYGSFAVNLGQILPATKKDGTVVAGMKNILLGAADKTRKVSVPNDAGEYDTIEMTNQEIVDAVAASRKAYKAEQTAPAEAGAEA